MRPPTWCIASFATKARAAGVPCLARPEIAGLNELAARSESVYGRDLDIEWVVASGRAYLVQCRAITTLAASAVA